MNIFEKTKPLSHYKENNIEFQDALDEFLEDYVNVIYHELSEDFDATNDYMESHYKELEKAFRKEYFK